MRKKIYKENIQECISFNPFVDYKRSHWNGLRYEDGHERRNEV